MTTPPKPVPPHPDVSIIEHTETYRGRWRVERVRFQVRRFDGTTSHPYNWEVFQRGHAVAVLPYDPVRDAVVLIQQFRMPALMAGLDPWLIEVPAGVIEGDEPAEEVARRELMEETGQTVKRLERIGRYLPSPGGCSETITLFAGHVDAPSADAEGVAGHAGLAHENEDIRVLVVPAETALSWPAAGRIVNGTTFLALHWLALHRTALRDRWR
ncbi:MAG: NUDIX domain-containing protein [Alphaproteobacteria bacterium]|nr:NUDIX domain-containing protein [Alphaproteobacteria bacterium]